MQITLLAFAQAADQVGFRERTVECSADDTPRTLLGRIAPAAKLDNIRVALDQEYADWDTPIGSISEIALIPPVSGG